VRALAIAAVLAAASVGSAAPDYSEGGRAATITAALAAIRGAGAGGVIALEDAIGAAARDRCGSTPSVPCLIEAATATCAAGDPAKSNNKDCLRIADVIVTNRAAETERVSVGERYQLMGSADGYRVAIRRVLRRHYARLAAELAVAPERGGDLGASIDRFCARRARVTALAWQRCVAALVYYVGTES
jgi:hypothetical protein